MRIINRTKLPKKLVHELINSISGKLSKYIKTVIIRHDKNWVCGGYYYYKEGKIVLTIGTPDEYPIYTTRQNDKFGYLKFYIRNDIESLIFLASHEIRHIFHLKISKQNWYKNAKMIDMEKDGEEILWSYKAERDADKFAIKGIKKYRETIKPHR